ncbi:MAG: ABC transporter permease [Treponema sp.]|jgi:simple sugar transport system permease protein|nr:ABC transporter permease [Treponema sp.]
MDGLKSKNIGSLQVRHNTIPTFREIIKNPLTFSVMVLAIVLVMNVIKTGWSFFKFEIVNGLVSGYIPDILNQSSTLVMVTLGMTLVIAASGGPDISVGAIMAVAASVCGLVLNGSEYRTTVFHNPYILGLFAGLLSGALCGAFNGLMVSFLKIQPMIATLILFTSGRAIGKIITYGQSIYNDNPAFRYLGVQIPGWPVRTTIIVSFIMIVIVLLFTKLTSLGLYIQSVGVNSSASHLVGLNSPAIKLMTFIFCGVLAGMAGLVESSNVGMVNTGELGMGIELNAILAVALGGNMLGGGKFTIAGSVIGAYTVGAVTMTIRAMEIPAYAVNAVKAIIILIIIVVSSDVFRIWFKKLALKLFSNTSLMKAGYQ